MRDNKKAKLVAANDSTDEAESIETRAQDAAKDAHRMMRTQNVARATAVHKAAKIYSLPPGVVSSELTLRIKRNDAIKKKLAREDNEAIALWPSEAPEAPPKDFLGRPSQADPKLVHGDHVEIADVIITRFKSLGFERFKYDEGALYVYKTFGDNVTGVWQLASKAYQAQLVHQLSQLPIYKVDPHTGEVIREPETGEKIILHRLMVNDRLVDGVIRTLAHKCAHDEFFFEAPNGIAFSDKFVAVTAEGLVRKKHSWEHRARHAYPFPLPKRKHKPERFLTFLREIFEGDKDVDEKILLLQEMFGAALAKLGPRYERVFLLLGNLGANGKSTLGRILEDIMPTESVCTIPPTQFADQYIMPRMKAKLLNIVWELGAAKLTLSLCGAIKATASGESSSCREPGEKAVVIRPVAAHVFLANQLPEVEDTSGGFMRRFNIVTFNRTFENDPRKDPELSSKILASERAEIVRWALEGAVRLLQNRKYTEPASHTKMIQEWSGDTDRAKWFVDNHCVKRSHAEGMSFHNLYMKFHETAYLEIPDPARQSYKMSPDKFAKRLRALGYAPKKMHGGIMRYGLWPK